MNLDEVFSPKSGTLFDIKESVTSGKKTEVFCPSENCRYHIACYLERPILYVVSDLVVARNAFDRMCEYGATVAILPEKEDILIARKNIDYGLTHRRLSLLDAFFRGKTSLIVTVESLLTRYPKRKLLTENVLHIQVGDRLDTAALTDKLAFCGYSGGGADGPATFGVRGETIDVWPVGSEYPVRIGLFDDEVETVRTMAPDTMLRKENLKEVFIYPATDFLVTEEDAKDLSRQFRVACKGSTQEQILNGKTEEERLFATPSSPLNTYFLPFADKYTDMIYAYLPKNGVVVFDDTRLVEDKLKLIRNSFCARVDALSKTFLTKHKEAIWNPERVSEGGQKLGFDRIAGRIGIFEPEALFTVKAIPLPPYYNDPVSFYDQVKQHLHNRFDVCIYVPTEEMKKEVASRLIEQGIGTTESGKDGVRILVGKVRHGFLYPSEKLFCVGINDLYRKTQSDTSKRARERKQIIELPEPGDYVVEERNGIGISEGLQRIKLKDGEKDFFVILYKGGERLYLPADRLNTVEKYTGSDKPTLHRMGGAEFERVKKRIKESVRAMAFDLLKLYQARYNVRGHVYQPDTVWQKEMEADFPYKETEDQLSAIKDVKSDMESGKVMDRLLCGDVGFGKTEVAVRAIFKTVIEYKQAAFLAPTTILAQQHYELLCSRFDKFGIKIELLSRFVDPKSQKEALKRLASGESQVVVATHRLLSDDVVFKDLGLLVLDEEQRFGVEQKEKMKLYRNKVNMLSLSATPIPRTLHMALSGIRDISVLETPPQERIPVETYVTEYSDDILVDAMNKELARGGQAFILYNRVDAIEKFFLHVKDLLGSRASVSYAHGQMDEATLEKRIKDFYDGKTQILVSTTIIENGVDLPNANTIFIIDSDRLGLSQMYQLRGRVGRRDVLSYAYFTVPEGKVLTKDAIKRLDALMENTTLGSGFGLAMRDMEIRGTGNVLGREQHGQMEKVGYDMYVKLVKQGMDELQGKATAELCDTEMRVEGSFALDDAYIPDSKARTVFYRQVASLSSWTEAKRFYMHLAEDYGTPPDNIGLILMAAVIRNLARQVAVKTVTIGASVSLRFVDDSCLKRESLAEAVEKYGKIARLQLSSPPMIHFICPKMKQSEKMSLILKFLDIVNK